MARLSATGEMIEAHVTAERFGCPNGMRARGTFPASVLRPDCKYKLVKVREKHHCPQH